MGLFKYFSLLLVSVCFLITIASNIDSCFAQNTPQDYLAAHNAARAQVGVGPIRWDARLATYAQNYANRILRANTCHRQVHSGGPYGENLAAGTGLFTGRRAVSLWVAEKSYYHYGSNSCARGRVCGHYTQVVWRRSAWVGCARVRCASGWWYVICSYSPRGNIVGQRPY